MSAVFSPGEQDLSVSSLFSFKNHVCLITGGATGLGEMAAQAFVQNGARVIIASRKEKELKEVILLTPESVRVETHVTNRLRIESTSSVLANASTLWQT